MGSSADEVTADGRAGADEDPDDRGPGHGADETLTEQLDGEPRRSTSTSPAVPERIGRYAVLRRIGAGGMGVVYEAHDGRVDRRVALKLLRDRGDETERLRLVREAQALAKLSHPHVVQVFEVGTQDERTYLVMELVDGTSLDRWLAAEPRDVRRILEVLVQAGEGLAAAHAAGLVHRDFKPGNVLVGADGRVRVLDFGVARASVGIDVERPASSPLAPPTVWARDLTHAGAIVGTPAYMSPEQLGTEAVTAASDQFAFCVVLYAALFGQHPFDGSGNVHALLHDILHGRVRPPPAVRDVSPALRAAVLRGLATDPRARWPSMGALLHALRATQRPSRWKRWAAASFVVVATAATGGAWALAPSPAPVGPAACTAAAAKLAEVWSPSQRAAIEQAFLATALPYAAQTWERVAPRLDDYGAAWSRAHAEACEAGLHDAAALDHRMACLERLRRGLATQVAILEHADATVVEQAVAAVAGLPPPPDCMGETADGWAAESDGERAARYATLTAELERVETLARSGKYREALAAAEPLLAGITALPHPLLEARARLAMSKVHEELGSYPEAQEQLERAYFLGQAGGHAKLVREAAARLVFVVGVNLQDHAGGLEWARHAEAELERDADALAEAALLSAMAALYREQEEYTRALRLNEQSLALYRKELPPGDMRIAWALASAGIILRQLGRNGEAMQHQAQAIAIAEGTLGPGHPQVGGMLGSLAAAQLDVGETEQAVATMQRSLAIQEAIVGPRSVSLGQPLSNLSVILARARRFDEAEQAARRAIEILEESGEQPRTLCNAIHNHAAALQEAARYARALPSHRRALAVCEEAGLGEHLSFALYLVSFSLTLDELGQLEEAEAMLRRAVAIYERADEVVTERLMVALARLAKVTLARGSFADARAHAERWLALEPTSSQPARVQAWMRWTLAQACWGTGDRARALALARDAAARAATLGDDDRERTLRAELRAFLAEHDPETRAR